MALESRWLFELAMSQPFSEEQLVEKLCPRKLEGRGLSRLRESWVAREGSRRWPRGTLRWERKSRGIGRVKNRDRGCCCRNAGVSGS